MFPQNARSAIICLPRLMVLYSSLLILFAGAGNSLAACTFTTIDDPSGVEGTYAFGISEGVVVGHYLDNHAIAHGYIYNISSSTWTTLDDPLGVNGTYPQGISGLTVVGYYLDSSNLPHGFVYQGSSYTSLNAPGSRYTTAYGISGGIVVGGYQVGFDSSGTHGFSYNGSAFTNVDDPLASSGTTALGIANGTVTGTYTNSDGTFGFTNNGSGYLSLDDPASSSFTRAFGTSLNLTIGDYITSTSSGSQEHGFIFDGTTFSTLDDPLATTGSGIYGIDGSTIVGTYNTLDNGSGLFPPQGFIASVPEPSGFCATFCVSVGACMFFLRRKPRDGASVCRFRREDSLALQWQSRALNGMRAGA